MKPFSKEPVALRFTKESKDEHLVYKDKITGSHLVTRLFFKLGMVSAMKRHANQHF